MSLLFKNYSVAKLTYLGTRLNEMKSYLGNKKKNNRNSVNKQNTEKERERKITFKRIKKYEIKGTLHFQNKPLYLTNYYFSIGKMKASPFWKN